MTRRISTCLMIILVCAVIGTLAKPSFAVVHKPTIYNLDMRFVWSLPPTISYDVQHTAVCIQGLANRDAPRVFLTFNDEDAIWLGRLRESGGLCEGWDLHNVTDIFELINLFRDHFNALVLYSPDPTTGVISTSLVATTAAGIENALAVRKDTSPTSMYNYLFNTMHIPVQIDLTDKFPAGGYEPGGQIWQTAIPSTGSRKCDAYIWAKVKYIDSGLSNPAVLSYTLDLWALKVGLGNNPYTQFSNVDYAIQQKGFCFELSPWGDEKPNDDPTQPLGTDLNTFKQILDSCNIHTGQNKMIKFCGFPNWHLKYTDIFGGLHTPVNTEWETVKLCSAYNTYMEAEAPNPNNVSNTSFFAALLPAFKGRRYTQNPPPTYNDMVTRGLINASGQVVWGNYVLLNMGDYDSASWPLYNLGIVYYSDPARGQVYCNWAVNPNLADRVCVVFDYMYRNKSPKDYFLAWDSGAGYINPSQLHGARSPSGYPSGVGIWQKHCKEDYRLLDYSISGWLLNGSMTMTTTDSANAAPFSGDGIGMHKPVNFGTPLLQNNIPVDAINIDQGIIDFSPFSSFFRPRFAWYRTVLQSPTQIKAQVDSFASNGNNHRFLDAYTYYYLLRYDLGGNNNHRATWIGDTIPRIMQTGQTYNVNVTVRNDGWDTWASVNGYALGYAIVPPGTEPVTGHYDAHGRYYSTDVAPGATTTFSVSIAAPSTPGVYNLHYDMVHEQVTWFREAHNLEWKTQIIVANDINSVDTDLDGFGDVLEEQQGTLYWNPDSFPTLKADLNSSLYVDTDDLAIFTDTWLKDNAQPSQQDYAGEFEAGWNAGTNPNGVWTYGWYDKATHTTFAPYGASGSAGSVLLWHGSDTDVRGNCNFNHTASTFGPIWTNGMSWRPWQACLMTGIVDGDACARFTAPQTDQYQISAQFENRIQTGASTNVHVMVNGLEVDSGVVSGFTLAGTPAPPNIRNYTSTLALAAGETVDFTVSGGGLHQIGLDLNIAKIGVCGGQGFQYMKADYNTDCVIDLNDFATFASQWFLCNNPQDLNCTLTW